MRRDAGDDSRRAGGVEQGGHASDRGDSVRQARGMIVESEVPT
jgi:hypothetical protein